MYCSIVQPFGELTNFYEIIISTYGANVKDSMTGFVIVYIHHTPGCFYDKYEGDFKIEIGYFLTKID